MNLSLSASAGRTENLNPRILHQLCIQMHKLREGEQILDGIRIHPGTEDDPTDIRADISGPDKTPYEGGVFKLKLSVCAEFPKVPPKAFFVTRIFHPNVDAKSGEVCVNTLKSDWQPAAWSIGHILQVIRCLLIVPFPESALNEESGKLFMEDYASYCVHARMLTRIHATAATKTAKKPLQVSLANILVSDDAAKTGRARMSVDTLSPTTPHTARRLSLDEDFSADDFPATPSSSRCPKSPFVGSPVRAKRLCSSIRRL
jgi:ubiquitin-conjugating enzyme E2 S